MYKDYQYDEEYRNYTHKYVFWRSFKTFNEIRQNHHAKKDGFKTRAKRNHVPQIWDDRFISRNYGKDWKRFTKKRKQWMK